MAILVFFEMEQTKLGHIPYFVTKMPNVLNTIRIEVDLMNVLCVGNKGKPECIRAARR
jgi:hypothetical protein